MVFVFASIAMVNANSNVEIVENINSNNSVEYARDCVDKAIAATEAIAVCFGEDIRGENQDYYLSVYMDLYEGCMMYSIN